MNLKFENRNVKLFCLLFENLGHMTSVPVFREIFMSLFASLLSSERKQASTCTIILIDIEILGLYFQLIIVFFSTIGGFENNVCVVSYPCDLSMDCFSLNSH